MNNFDERPLERVTEPDPALAVRPRPTLGPIALITAVGLLLGAAAAWWWMRSDSAAPAAPRAVTGTDAAVPAAAEPARPLPPLDQMDTFLRALLGAISSHPDLARWLATDDLVRQMASGIDRISRGQSPASDLPMLRPGGDFAVSGRRNALTIDPRSFRRYDRFASLMESVDPRAVADAYRTIQPRLDEAYRGLGRSTAGVDAALDIALATLIETPVPDTPVTLVPGQGATYAYRDPAIERLSPIQKQLIRMGPENQRAIQSRLREIRAALANSDNRVR